MSDAREILDKVASGEMTPEEAETALKMKPFVDLGFAKPDLHRGIRQGIPERSRKVFLKAESGQCLSQDFLLRRLLS